MNDMDSFIAHFGLKLMMIGISPKKSNKETTK